MDGDTQVPVYDRVRSWVVESRKRSKVVNKRGRTGEVKHLLVVSARSGVGEGGMG